ncbi:DegT/DnrJ/EryC1/StrS family aminotransferase [Candidatus Omnitrophota bacterium]
MKYIKWDQSDIGNEEIESVVGSLRSGYVGSNGPMVKQFEQEFASEVGAEYAIAVCNGTAALLTALYAFRSRIGGLKVGVPTFSFIASANTAAEAGDAIKLIDCSMKTWNIERALIPSGINLLMSADIGGLPCDYNALKSSEIPIIADSAESIGAMYRKKPIGSQADVHCFSFHRAKIITTGEGGMVTTNDKELYELMRSLVNHGYDPIRKKWEYKHKMRAFNFRMTEVEAAIGTIQLKKLKKYVDERRKRARIYRDIIGELAEYQDEPKDRVHPYFFFGMLIKKDRDTFCDEMDKKGIEVKTWTPAHKQKPYMNTGESFSNADRVGGSIVLLPMHNKLTGEEAEYIAETARKLLK